MTLQLALKLTADGSSLRREAGSARAEIIAFGKDARATGAELDALGAKLDQVAAKAGAAGAAANNNRPSAQALINSTVGVRDDFGSAQRAADIAGYGKALDDLRAKYNPLFAAQRAYLAQLAEIRQAEKVGALSTKEAAAAIDRTKASFATHVNTLNGRPAGGAGAAAGAAAGGLQPYQRANLLAQGNDVAQSLALGMSPLQVALQQGPQIIQLFGGVRQTLSAATSVLTPLRVGLGGVTAALAIGAVAWNSYLQSTKAVETALAGVGRGSGATASQLEDIARSGAAAAGMSISSSREMTAELLRTGRIGVESFSGIIGMSKNFAATIGADTASAKGILTEIFADPAKGAEQLFNRYRLIDSATMRYVQQLVAQNREEEARLVLIGKLPARLVDAEKALVGFARVAANVGKVWDGFWNGLDRAIAGPTRQERIKQLEERLARPVVRGWGQGPRRQADEAELGRLREEERLERERAKAEADRQKRDEDGNKALDIAKGSPVNERLRREKELKDQLGILREGRNAPNLKPEEVAQIDRQIDATKRAIDSLREYRTEAEKNIALDRLDFEIGQARDPVTRAELMAQRERIALSGQVVTSAEAEAAAERARTRALQEAIGANRTRVAEMREQASAQRSAIAAVTGGASQADAERQMRLELELRPLLAAAAKAEGEAKRQLLEEIERLKAAYGELGAAEKEAAGQRFISDQEQRLERLRAEIAVVGESAATQRRAIDLVAADQKIKAEGIGPDQAARIRANVVKEADLTTALERQKAAFEDLRSTGSRAFDTIGEKLLQNRDGWKGLGDTAKSVANDISSTLLRMAVLNPLKNMLLGTNNPTISDVGGWVGKLLGNAASNDNAVKTAVPAAATPSASDIVGLVPKLSPVISKPLAPPPAAIGSVLNSTANRYDIPAAEFTALARIESGFRPNATNGRHAGLFQFSPDTGAQYGLTSAARFDPAASADAAARLWKDNSAALRPVLGREALGWEAYVAHQQGIGGARALFGNPDMRATDALNSISYYRDRPGLAAKAITGNGGSADMTSAQFLDVWKDKFERMGGSLDTVAKSGDAAGTALASVSPAVKDVSGALAGSASSLAGAGTKIEVSAEKIAGGASGGGIFDQLLGGLGKLVSGIGQGIGSIVQGIGGGIGNMFGGAGSLISSLFGGAGGAAMMSGTGGLYHTGGIVGAGAAPSSRTIRYSDFVGAPRFHEGGLMAGERRIIAQDKEGIFTPRQMDNADAILQAALRPREVRLAVDNTMRTSMPLPGGADSGRRGIDRVQIINSGRPVEAEAEEQDGPDGRTLQLWMDEQTAGAVGRSGSRTGQAMRGRFGVTAPRVNR